MRGTQRTKGKITAMINGPFIFKADNRPTRLFCMNIAFMKTLRIWFQGKAQCFQYFLCVCVFCVTEYEGQNMRKNRQTE